FLPKCRNKSAVLILVFLIPLLNSVPVFDQQATARSCCTVPQVVDVCNRFVPTVATALPKLMWGLTWNFGAFNDDQPSETLSGNVFLIVCRPFGHDAPA